MNYFCTYNGITEVYKTNIKEIYRGYERYLSIISKDYFLDIKFYNKCISKRLNIKREIPIKLSDKLMFFRINDRINEYYINYYNIVFLGYEDDNTLIIFKDGSYLEINENIIKFKKMLSKCKKIENYILNNDNEIYK